MADINKIIFLLTFLYSTNGMTINSIVNTYKNHKYDNGRMPIINKSFNVYKFAIWICDAERYFAIQK